VLFVRRVHYLAHPRHDGRIVRRLDNEDDVVATIERWQRDNPGVVELLPGTFSSMTVGEQVAAAQEACVITGAHGAGLSHVLFAPPDVHMLELRPPAFMRPHFISYAFWSGAVHHDWALQSSIVSPTEVVKRLAMVADEATGGVRKHPQEV